MESTTQFILEDIGNFLDKLAEKSESVYWLSSPNFQKIQYISPAFEKIWGRSRDALYADPELWINYLHPDDVKDYHPIHKMAEQVAKLGQAARYEENYRIIRPDGEIRWIIDRGFPIYNKDGTCAGITGVAIDITKEKQVEEALYQAKDKAEAASKAKTEFLENMRHDIRTPLTGIIGFSDIIKNEASDPKIKEYADNLVVSSHALLDLLNEVLEAIKVASGEIPVLKKKFDLKAKVNHIVDLNQARAAEKHLDFQLNYDDAIPHYLIGDSTRIQRILLELVTNALNFTNTGHVHISIKLAKKEDRKRIIKITIEDTGIGIPSDKKEDIFVHFKRLTPSYQGIYKGAGLGLSIVRQFIDELQGEIYVESELGKGSTFTCVVPFEEALLDEPDGQDDHELSLPSYKNHNKQVEKFTLEATHQLKEAGQSYVLVVEDQEIAAMIVRNHLLALNCEVDVAKDGKTACELAQDNAYDLIFMDIGLPDMTGLEVTKFIRTHELAKKSPVPIVALTAHVDKESKQHCIDVGMNAVFSKPLVKEKAEDILNAFIPTRKQRYNTLLTADLNDKNLSKQEAKIVDIEYAKKQLGGDEKLVHKMLTLFVESIPEELENLQSAYEKKDWLTIKEIAHKLKGGCCYIGTLRLNLICLQFETAVKSGQTELFVDLYNQMLIEIELAEKMIREKFVNL